MNQMISIVDVEKDGREVLRPWPTAAAIGRMAARARIDGMEVRRRQSGERVDHFVFDPRDRKTYFVCGFGCSCATFARLQGCRHFSLLLTENGWVPADAEVVESADLDPIAS